MSKVPYRTLPVIWSGIFAILLTLMVGGIWTGLTLSNLALTPMIPWSVGVMGLLLVGLWQYLGGAGFPSSTRVLRHDALRARPVSLPVLSWACIAGSLAIIALAGLWMVLFHLAGLPIGRNLPQYGQYPLLTVALIVIMASLVGAVLEEALFRGYFQSTLEHHLPAAFALLVVAVVMAPEHAFTQGFLWPTLVFYFCVDIMLGTMAFLTNSIIPGIIIHSIGLLLFFTVVWPGDIVRQWVGQGSTDAWFFIHIGQVGVFGLLAILAFLRLKNIAASLGNFPRPR
jgi:membrane protease YdiL (CAAX protease family)